MKNHIGTVGLSFQFKSNYYKRSDLEQALVEACKIAQSDLSSEYPENKITYHSLVANQGRYIFEAISEKIRSCDILAAEVSDLNNNVYLEIGYALGKNIYLLSYINEEASKAYNVASDLQGFFVERYSNTEDIRIHLSTQIVSFFRRKWTIENEKSSKLELIDRFWNFRHELDVSLVSGEVVLGTGPTFVQSGDKDAYSEITVAMSQLYPQLILKRYSCSQIKKSSDYTGNIISIGGPNSNKVTKTILEQANIDINFKRIEENWTINGHHPKEIFLNGDKTIIQPEYSSNEIIKEVICIGSGPNPLNRHKKAFIFFGLHTYGVLGAVNAIIGTGEENLHNYNIQYMLDIFSDKKFKLLLAKVLLLDGKCIISELRNNSYVV